jgi:hypothetical protein
VGEHWGTNVSPKHRPGMTSEGNALGERLISFHTHRIWSRIRPLCCGVFAREAGRENRCSDLGFQVAADGGQTAVIR